MYTNDKGLINYIKKIYIVRLNVSVINYNKSIIDCYLYLHLYCVLMNRLHYKCVLCIQYIANHIAMVPKHFFFSDQCVTVVNTNLNNPRVKIIQQY